MRGGESFDNAVQETLHAVSIAVVNEKLKPLIGRIEAVKAQYGKLLKTQGIGVDVPPAFGDLKTSWSALSLKWLTRKRATPQAPQFYRGISPESTSLGQALFDMPTERLFGRTQVTTRVAQMQTPGFYNPRIRRRIDTIWRQGTGQFARPDPGLVRAVKLRIDPAPGIGKSAPEMIRQLPLPRAQKVKLFGNDVKRPLIEPFTDWFFGRKLRFLIEQGVRELT
jgi:hypothetical protein